MLNKEKPVTVEINEEMCVKCGLCAKACSIEYILFEDNRIKINENAVFGCIQCGYCMINCPNNSIKIRGEGISENDIIPLSENLPDFDSVNSLFIKRRSIRKFKNQEIPKEIIDKIISAASTAPMSIPPSEVKVLVINGFDKVQVFAEEVVERLDKFAKIMNPFLLGLFKPFMGKANYKMFKDFIIPLVKMLSDEKKQGKDLLFYNAPAVIIFYNTELIGKNEKEDAIIAATYADIAAQALGLGTCIIGSVPPAFDAKLKKKYCIGKNETPVMAFILGYPDQEFNKGIKRRFNSVKYN